LFFVESGMPLTTDIQLNRQKLIGIIATLLAVVGLGPVAWEVRLRVLRTLRPAEAAVRRLIVLAAQGLVLKPAVHRPMPPGLSRQLRVARKDRRLCFPLSDPQVRMVEPVRKKYFKKGPRVSFIAPADPTITAVFEALHPAPVVPTPSEPKDENRPMLLRLEAVRLALEDLPRQAQRLLRWRERRRAIAAKRLIYTSPLRPGRAPYMRKFPVSDVDYVLERCHLLAREACAPIRLERRPSVDTGEKRHLRTKGWRRGRFRLCVRTFIMTLSSNLRGIACMVLASVSFVLCDSCLKMMLLSEVPPLQTLVLRGIFAIVSCLILLAALGYLREIPRAFGLWTVVRALMEVISVSAFIYALANVPIADITAIYQISPLIVLAGASVIWGEHVGPARWLLIALGFAGALLVARPGAEGASPYALLGLITAVGSAVRDLLSRHVPDDVPGPVITLTVVVLVWGFALVGSLLFETWVPVSPLNWVYALGAGTFVMIAHLFVFLAFRFASARAVAPFYYGLTLFAVIAGIVFFGEFPVMIAIVGILMIIGCGLGVLLLERKGVK
jgi:drug/metabolite transporter (DMT)-like permease